MATLAQAQHMASPDRVPPRKPLSPEATERIDYRSSDEYQESSQGGRDSMQQLSVQQPSRIQAAPKSPVKIEFQNEEWAQPSTVQIENVNSRFQGNYGGHRSNGSDQYYQGMSEATLRSSPQRQQLSQAQSGNIYGSQHGVLSNGDSSTQSYNDTLVNGRSSGDSGNSSDNPAPVQPLHYHHLSLSGEPARRSSGDIIGDQNEYSRTRHLTPHHNNGRTGSQRPMSTYSDMPFRGPSPGHSPLGYGSRSAQGSPDGSRPGSYVDLPGQYNQSPTAVVFGNDNTGLRNIVGTNASLLSTDKTFQLYRQNLKKTTDPEVHFTFALLLVDAAKDLMAKEGPETPKRKNSPKPGKDQGDSYVETASATSQDHLREAKAILQKLADRSMPFAQYYLADGLWTGLFNKGKEDYATAFQLFVAASKHGHAESSYRAALCYEFGWGTRLDTQKAYQFYRQAATKNHPGAMTRLGRAGLTGDLGEKQVREAIKWLKRATEAADTTHNSAPFFLGELYVDGFGDDIFKDETYAAQLFTQAADLGNAEAAFRLGQAYEHGQLTCPRDPSLSVHFYTLAANKGHPEAMLAVCAWYLVGAEPALEKDENEAYEWAKRSAEAGLTKAQYAMGYFTEMGIGCRRDPLEANVWYVRAADSGDERAKARLALISAASSGKDPKAVAKEAAKMKKKAEKARAKQSGAVDAHDQALGAANLSPVAGQSQNQGLPQRTSSLPPGALEVAGRTGTGGSGGRPKTPNSLGSGEGGLKKVKEDKECVVM